MSEQETAGSSTAAEVDRPEPGADRYTSGQEAGSSSTEAEADRRPPGAGRLDVAQPCSIAVAHRRCMQPAASEHSSMTSLVVE